MQTSETSPRLQPPGGGLPAPERFVLGLLVSSSRWWMPRERAARSFRSQADRVLQIAGSLPPERAGKPVLVRRLAGIEDSSRFWSVYMVLDHLRIVDDAMASLIESLVAGKPFGRVVSVADVKPRPGCGPEVMEEFSRAAREFLERTGKIPDLRTPLRQDHPWFGPLDAAAWHRLAALHHGLHRRQIERILSGLR